MTLKLNQLVDSWGRPHNNLRISVTDRCNIRCVYCMPENVQFLPRADLLTFEEIERFTRVAVPLGINKVRLTGGEPLVRRDLPKLIEKLKSIEGLEDVGLTTNGILLAPVAETLRNAGLLRINISLDTLDRGRFERLTRRPGLEQVIEGILAAKRAGFEPVKVNAVAIRGETEEDVVPLAAFAREHGLELRFIEYMPLDAGHRWEREKVLFAAEIIERIALGIGPLTPVCDPDPEGACARLRVRGRRREGRVHRVGEPAVLHELQPVAADIRRQAPQLPVLARGERCARVASRRGKGRGDRGGDPGLRGLEVGGARNQHVAVHPAGAADALDRRVGPGS